MSIVIGRWSEFMLTWAFQVVSEARCADMIEISGELGFWCGGTRVGLFVFMVIVLLLFMHSASVSPRC